MSDNENKGLPLTIKIIIGILIAIVAVIVGFVFIIANTIRKAGNEIKNNNERDTYNITVRVDDVVLDPDDSMYDIEHVTIISVEEKAENSEYVPHVGDTLTLHHYLMHTTPDEVGDSIDLKVKDGEIVNVFTKWYEIYKGKSNISTSTDASDIAKSMVGKFNYPYKIFPAGTDYDQIIMEYNERFEIGKTEGFTPVLVPVDSVLEEYWEIVSEDGFSLEDVLKGASSEEGKRFLEERYKDYTENSEISESELIGEYEDEPEVIDGVTAIVELGSSNTLETILFEVPTANPWEVVAYLPSGGWNACPQPENMISVCKYWYEKYGAIPVTISHDTLEFSVPECIKEDEAIELAKEHYAFTPDRVDQCTRSGSLKEVAESLKVSKFWYFWWD